MSPLTIALSQIHSIGIIFVRQPCSDELLYCQNSGGIKPFQFLQQMISNRGMKGFHGLERKYLAT
jgi:hypothetical protein